MMDFFRRTDDVIHGKGGTSTRVEWTGPTKGDATVTMWEFVADPPQHPAWNRYVVVAVHLREEEGVHPPNIHREGATHEVMMLALDPNGPDLEDTDKIPFLQPANALCQVKAESDEIMVKATKVVAAVLAKGQISIEQVNPLDPLNLKTNKVFSQWWTDAIDKTIEHMTLGGHPRDMN